MKTDKELIKEILACGTEENREKIEICNALTRVLFESEHGSKFAAGLGIDLSEALANCKNFEEALMEIKSQGKPHYPVEESK